MRMFSYEAQYYDEDYHRVETTRGIIAGESYQDAMEQLYEFCVAPAKRGTDEDELVSVKLEELDNPLDWDTLEEIIMEEQRKNGKTVSKADELLISTTTTTLQN